MTKQYHYASICELHDAFKTKKLTVKELVLHFLNRIDKIDTGEKGLHSVVEINPDAIYIAEVLDKKFESGEPIGFLFGIPILVKDSVNTADKMHTSAGSLALKNNFAPYDADIIKKLRDADAVILGKTNMTEFSNFMTDGEMPDGYSSRGGQVVNPFIRTETPGGSSSGSGVAVAAGLCTAAIGVETCGSIVYPSSQNGIVGIKPTIGLVSRNGIVPISFTCDTAGPMARTVEDAVILLNVISSIDKRDNLMFLNPEKICNNVFKIGIYRPDEDSVGEEHKEAFHYLCKMLKETGVTLVDNLNMKFDFNMWHLTKNEFESAINNYLSILGENVKIKTLSDIIAYNEAHVETALKYGQSTFNYIKNDNAATLTGIEYLNCLENREKIISDFEKVFEQYEIDVILCETFNNAIAQFTGFPSMVLPIGQREDKHPIDCYLMARRFDEKTLVQVATIIEKILGITVRPEV